MFLGSVGSSTWSAVSATVGAASAVVEAAADIVSAHPLLVLAAAVGGYELMGNSNNPAHLGQNVDTSA